MNIERFLEQIISVFFFFTWIEAAVHWEMTTEEDSVKKLKKVTYRQFKHKALNTDWDVNYKSSLFKKSLIISNGIALFHASIVRFEDVGYIMTPYGFFKASILAKKIVKRKFKGYNKPYIK